MTAAESNLSTGGVSLLSGLSVRAPRLSRGLLDLLRRGRRSTSVPAAVEGGVAGKEGLAPAGLLAGVVSLANLWETRRPVASVADTR